MSFLWTKKRSNIKQNRMPSPTHKKVESDQKSRIKIPLWFARRISLFTSFLKGKKVRASMTVEAAFLLPLFMFFFFHLMSSVEMIRLHGKLTLAMWDAGKQLTVYGALTEATDLDVPDIGVSYIYVKNRAEYLLGKEYLDNSPLVYGRTGLNFVASEYNEEVVEIDLTYQVRPQITIFPFGYMRMGNRFLGKTWTGFDLSGEIPKYVYVTLYGEVWHAIPGCSHIKIDVYASSVNSIRNLRNKNGERYELCELCGEETQKDVVFYTTQGERYHNKKDCSALVRYVRAIVWKSNIPYRPCSKCVKE